MIWTCAWTTLLLANVASAGPVRVFILAGQSNMEGPGSMKHMGELLANSTTSKQYEHLWSGTTWTYRDDAFIKYLTRNGNLTMGYGSSAERFGPELEFGWVVADAMDEKVLIIKTAWGGQPLAVTFRPPSSGTANYTYFDPKTNKTNYYPISSYGYCYHLMVNDVIQSLSSLDQYVPGYNQSDGYILSGFVWFQGWQDHLSWDMIKEYKRNLINLIYDIRLAFHSPDLPVVIGELGQGGVDPPTDDKTALLAIRKIEEEVAALKEFNGIVRFVKTSIYVVNGEEYFDGGLHYWGRADTFFNIGRAFGEAMLDLVNVTQAADLLHSLGDLASQQ